MRLLRKSRMTGKMLKMESEDEREPNPAKERPVSNMVLQEMWQKDGAEKAYFDYREKRMNAEAELQMLDGAEKLRIMKYFNSFNVIPNKKVDMAAEITVIPDPVIGNEHMELDWQIVLCNEKGEDIEETVPIDEVRPEDA
uniref:Uncharacterized protein n=1 Tax=Caenorhabditis japonica TaxID=281687 RepID=A0A8R1DH19_CAEJA